MKQKLTDLTGDGKITRKDFLRGAGVKGFSNGKSVRVPMEPDQETLDLIEQEIRETGSSKTQERIEAIMAGEQDGPAIKNKKQKRRGDDKSVQTYTLGGEVRGHKVSQVKGRNFSGTY